MYINYIKASKKHRFIKSSSKFILLHHQIQATEKGEAFDATSPPMFRASVELLSITCVLALTEDRSVTKRILQKGSSRRQPDTWKLEC
jgi:hypothetical protein